MLRAAERIARSVTAGAVTCRAPSKVAVAPAIDAGVVLTFTPGQGATNTLAPREGTSGP